jgi:ribosomal protein S8E
MLICNTGLNKYDLTHFCDYICLIQIGKRRVHTVRIRGGNLKFRALRLDHGNFSWGSEGRF